MQIRSQEFNELTPQTLYQILKLREKVFVLEQECLYQDLDDIDQRAWHTYMMEGDEVIAYARTFYKEKESGVVQIGRVVTAPEHRRQKKATEVFAGALDIARRYLKADVVYLEAQTYAIPFYRNFGFEVTSDVFLEDGIPHVKMTLTC